MKVLSGWRALLLGVLLSGCATPLTVDSLAGTPWPSRQAALDALQDWQISGRLAVTSEQEGWQASLYWTQQGQTYVIELIGPLGQGRVYIQGNRQGVRVRMADGQELYSTDPEQLLERAVGMRIPVTGLVYWVRGLPDPQRQSVLAGDAQGRLTRLEQGDWVVEYPRYARVGVLDLPAQIRAYRGDLRVQVAVQDWKLHPPPPPSA